MTGIRWQLLRDGAIISTCAAPDKSAAREVFNPREGDVVMSEASARIPMHPAIRLTPERFCAKCGISFGRKAHDGTMHSTCRKAAEKSYAARRQREGKVTPGGPGVTV